MTEQTQTKRTGVIARLPRDGKRGVVVTTDRKEEFQLRDDELPPGLELGAEVRFEGREPLDYRDRPDGHGFAATGFEWNVTRRDGAWIVKDRRSVEIEPPTDTAEDTRVVAVVIEVRPGLVRLQEVDGGRILLVVTRSFDGQPFPLIVGDEVRCGVEEHKGGLFAAHLERTPFIYSVRVRGGVASLSERRERPTGRPWKGKYPEPAKAMEHYGPRAGLERAQ